MYDENFKQLIAAILLQAVKDYVKQPKNRKTILHELRSNHMERITGGMGKMTADRLEFHLDEVIANLGEIDLFEEAV